jgi:ammonia channel protein AmtB
MIPQPRGIVHDSGLHFFSEVLLEVKIDKYIDLIVIIMGLASILWVLIGYSMSFSGVMEGLSLKHKMVWVVGVGEAPGPVCTNPFSI